MTGAPPAFVSVAWRLCRIAWVFGRLGVRAAARRAARRPIDGHLLLRDALQELSGAFVKFGQILALQIAMLPTRYCDALLGLLDRVPPFTPDQVDAVFLEELGQPPSRVYREFGTTPVASASIGQVHRATRHDGCVVAVKVQRPGVGVLFAHDIALMRAFVRVATFLRVRGIDFMREPVRELAAWTEDELDYRREASYCQMLADNAVHSPTERVPGIHWDLTTRRVLTMDFLEGVSVSDYLRAVEQGDHATLAGLAEQGFVADGFSDNVIHNFLSDAFRCGVFHADLHPANLLILPDNTVGYVDFGIVATLTPEARKKLTDLTLAYAVGDPDQIYEAFLNICRIEPHADLEGLRGRIEDLVEGWYAEPAVCGRVRFNVTVTRTFGDLLAACREYGVFAEREMVKYIRAIYLADGLVSRIAPGFDLAKALRTVVSDALTDDAQARVASRGAAISWVTSLAVWVDAGPGALLHSFSRLERRPSGRAALTARSSNGQARSGRSVRRALVASAVLVCAVFALGSGGPSWQEAPIAAGMAGSFVALWAGWVWWLLWSRTPASKE